MSIAPPRPRNSLSVRIGRLVEARASGWGVAALVALAGLAAVVGLAAPNLLGK